MQTATSIQDRLKAFGLTVVILLLLLLFLLFFKVVTPLPPFPPSITQELEIAFESGGGGSEGMTGSSSDVIHTSAEQQNANASDEDVNTNDVYEAVVTVKKTTTPKKTEKPTEQKTQPVVAPEPIPSLELAMALKRNKERMRGNGGTGNNQNGSGTGEGDGGNGSGKGGSGNGSGTGKGNGSSNYYLKGRNLLKSPELIYDTQEEGKVIVEIFVDETGKIIKATPGQRGSTTTSSVLFAKARQAALSMKYDASPDGTKEQKGYITIVFTLD